MRRPVSLTDRTLHGFGRGKGPAPPARKHSRLDPRMWRNGFFAGVRRISRLRRTKERPLERAKDGAGREGLPS